MGGGERRRNTDLGLPLLEAVDADPIPGLLDEDVCCRRHSPRGGEVDVLQIHGLRDAQEGARRGGGGGGEQKRRGERGTKNGTANKSKQLKQLRYGTILAI